MPQNPHGISYPLIPGANPERGGPGLYRTGVLPRPINYKFYRRDHLDRLQIPGNGRRRSLTRLLDPLDRGQARDADHGSLPGAAWEIPAAISITHRPDLRLFEVARSFFQEDRAAAC